MNDIISKGAILKDGYAPFCKHVFIPNFANVKCGYVAISKENEAQLKTCYESRNTDELPVPITYFDRNNVVVPEATYLDVILYSKEQINQEYIAMNKTPPETYNSEQWGIISVKGQMVDHELPMQPITM